MLAVIKGKEYIVELYKTFESFHLDLSRDGVVVSKLNKADKQQYWYAMEGIRCYMIENLKKFGMTWKDFKDYASKWFDEYKEQESSDVKPQQVIIWAKEE